ncbi:MAG: flgF, partial [Bacteriovoracaceae bacterium]|nr:flgF [Bacteriovoracaceae bacterium]
ETNVYTALSGQVAVAKQIDLVANNIANVNTTGFKAERPLFEKALAKENALLSSSLKKDVTNPNPFATQDFAAIKGSYADLSQGPTQSTGNPLDAAIEGKGFFVIQTPDGERYTRAGNFKLDATHRIVTQDNLPVQGSGGDIILQPGAIVTVTEDGTVNVDGKPNGKFRIVDLDPKNIQRETGQRFSSSAGATEVTAPRVVGGALEGSNVNAVKELADMILSSRLYEGIKNSQDSESHLDSLRNEKLGSSQG